MPDTVALVVASFIGGAVVAAINWIARRRLTKAETDKQISEAWHRLSDKLECRIKYLEDQNCQLKLKVQELADLLLLRDKLIVELQEQVTKLTDRLRKYEKSNGS